jgi:hypothetical protein
VPFRIRQKLRHRALAQLGSEPLPVGVHSPGHVADSDEQAREELWPAYQVMRNRIGAERGWPPTSRAEFEREVAVGSLYVGSPETVARTMAATVRALGATRFDLKYSAGTLRHEPMLRSIELYGRGVMPRVRGWSVQCLQPRPSEPMSWRQARIATACRCHPERMRGILPRNGSGMAGKIPRSARDDNGWLGMTTVGSG